MGPPEDSFTAFVRRWRRLVCEKASAVLGPVADCEDVAQRVFMRLWQDGRWRSIASPAPYLRAAARREAFSILRWYRRRGEVALGPGLLRQLSYPARRHVDAVDRRRELEWVAEQISTMPPRCRAACTLVFLGDCSHAEAADRLGVGPKAVEKLIARGRRHLKKAAEAQRRSWVSTLSDGGGSRLMASLAVGSYVQRARWLRRCRHGTRSQLLRDAAEHEGRGWAAIKVGPAFAACAVASLVLGPSALAAQSATMVRGEPECPSCEIRLEAVLTLGGLNGPGLATISRTSDVAVDAAGRILVAGGGVPDHVAVFDSLGTFLRTVGRRGQGPGEFMYISHIAPGSGSVHLFDALLKRRTILDGDLEFVDVHRIDGQVRSSVALEDGNLLFFADIPTASRVAEPLHILWPNGELVSFGADGSVYRGRLPEQTVAGRGNTIWTLESLRYRISRWDLSERRRVALFDLAAAWFDAEDSDSWPRSFLAGIREDAHGLWVIGETPDNRWTERAVKEGPIPTNPPSEVFDGVLDVVDPETGRTIAHGRWDDVFVGFVAGSDLIAMYRESVEGVPYIDLVRASLHRSLRNPHSRR